MGVHYHPGTIVLGCYAVVVVVVVVVVGIYLLVASIFGRVLIIQFQSFGKSAHRQVAWYETEGTVVDHVPSEEVCGRKRRRYQCVEMLVSFLELGSGNDTYTFVGSFSNPPPFAIGENITYLYNPENPVDDHVQEKTNTRKLIITSVVFAIEVLLIAYGCRRYMLRKQEQRREAENDNDQEVAELEFPHEVVGEAEIAVELPQGDVKACNKIKGGECSNTLYQRFFSRR